MRGLLGAGVFVAAFAAAWMMLQDGPARPLPPPGQPAADPLVSVEPPPRASQRSRCDEALTEVVMQATALDKRGQDDAVAQREIVELLRTARRLTSEEACPRAEIPVAEAADRRLVRALVTLSRLKEADGNLAAAIRLASEAEAVGLTDPSSKRGISLRLGNLLAKRADEATGVERRRARAEEALEVVPDHSQALFILGKACEELNDFPCAIDAAKRLKAASPESPGLDRWLAELERHAAVEADFEQARSDHFVARFEGYAVERVGWAAIRSLEKAYFRIGAQLDRRPDAPITVVIYTGGKYKEATMAPDWSGGQYDGKIRLREGDLLEGTARLEDVLFHEYTHALLRRTVGGPLPPWLNEGLAENMEPSFDHARARATLARYAAPLPLAQISTGSFSSLSDRQTVHLAYRQAASMVATLIDKQGMLGLSKLLDRLAERERFDEAFRAVYFKAPGAFFEEWARGVRWSRRGRAPHPPRRDVTIRR